jgi:hypothetical protein
MKYLKSLYLSFRRWYAYPRVIITQSGKGHRSVLKRRFLIIFWKTVQVNDVYREFDDVLVNLGVTYFTYLEKYRKQFGISRQVFRSRTGRFGKKVVRKSVRG